MYSDSWEFWGQPCVINIDLAKCQREFAPRVAGLNAGIGAAPGSAPFQGSLLLNGPGQTATWPGFDNWSASLTGRVDHQNIRITERPPSSFGLGLQCLESRNFFYAGNDMAARPLTYHLDLTTRRSASHSIRRTVLNSGAVYPGPPEERASRIAMKVSGFGSTI